MADLNELQAAGATKLIGADATGLETNPVNADSNGNLNVINPSDGPVAPGTAATKSALIGGQYNSALPTLATTQQSALQLDSNGRLILAPLTSASTITAIQGSANTHSNAWFTRLTDGTDDSLISPNGDLQTSDIINVSGQSRAQSITTSAAEALGAATILANRKFISISPTNGVVYWGYANTVTTANGTPIYKGEKCVLAFGPNIHVYLIAGSTVDCRIAEGS